MTRSGSAASSPSGSARARTKCFNAPARIRRSCAATRRYGPGKIRPAKAGLACRLHFNDLVGQGPSVFVGDGHVFPYGEAVLAEPMQRLVVADVALLIVEEPARAPP